MSNPVTAILGLLVIVWVKVYVVDDHHIGRSQVDTKTTCRQTVAINRENIAVQKATTYLLLLTTETPVCPVPGCTDQSVLA